jgi:hypothetical protein
LHNRLRVGIDLAPGNTTTRRIAFGDIAARTRFPHGSASGGG